MKVCIDAGHGMSNKQEGIFDPGATHVENGFEYEEATIALRYALTLKDVLRARGTDVFLTRDDATDHTPLGRRAKMAKDAGCNVLISLHLNDAEVDKANGIEVLYRDNPGKQLAQELQTALVKATGLKDRGIKERPELAVLKFTGPAALIELGFIANDGDREKLLDAQVRDTIAGKIADVLLA
jgi:N-acetylmuramoyl-L-alanine amidase